MSRNPWVLIHYYYYYYYLHYDCGGGGGIIERGGPFYLQVAGKSDLGVFRHAGKIAPLHGCSLLLRGFNLVCVKRIPEGNVHLFLFRLEDGELEGAETTLNDYNNNDNIIYPTGTDLGPAPNYEP